MTNKQEADEGDRILVGGQPALNRCNNKVVTSKYSLLSFLPLAILEQFRRVANMYFLVIGGIMAIGTYTGWYESAISPWTTLGPLAIVVSISLLQEGSADAGRHRADYLTNNHKCVVLRNAEHLTAERGTRDETVLGGQDVTVSLAKAYFAGSHPQTPGGGGTTVDVAFEAISRQDIRQGHFCLIRNRDMVPADMILLASSADNGNAYIETSSIDGETNLKLRTSPHLPKEVRELTQRQSIKDMAADNNETTTNSQTLLKESLEAATKRICRMSSLGYPHGKSALDNPSNANYTENHLLHEEEHPSSGLRIVERGKSVAMFAAHGIGGGVTAVKDMIHSSSQNLQTTIDPTVQYICALKTEPPNASVNTFTGVLVLPPVQLGGPSVEIPLNADNILLRGAVLRNTEWAIGLVCFTGKDTKLVQNSFETPSKFSQLDRIMNKTVIAILTLVAIVIAFLATMSVITNDAQFNELWYAGFSRDATQKWPYLPQEFEAPKWRTAPQNWIQVYLLFVTLLSNFVPLSLYVTIEIIVAVLRVLINQDLAMYDPYTDTRTVARSITVSDLGQVQYIFSDKTGTLTQNVMRFKRCSVDGLVFGAPVVKASPDADDTITTGFHPLRRLLVGKIPKEPLSKSRQHSLGLLRPGEKPVEGLEGLGESTMADDSSRHPVKPTKVLTFNGEMFLRVMSLCHTVVVEKDLDAKHGVISRTKQLDSQQSSFGASVHDVARRLFGFGSKQSKSSGRSEEEGYQKGEEGNEEEPREDSSKVHEQATGKSKGGAPVGFAYQAESPDEGALVEAASLKYSFQVVGRDSSGIRLLVDSPSLLSDDEIVKKIKNGTLKEADLAADTASWDGQLGSGAKPSSGESREETWEILAVNKFDSTRKRMSILVRSPPELGSIPMLLCKGADSAMLDPSIIDNPSHVTVGDEDPKRISQRGQEHEDTPHGDWDESATLSLQSHLGEFAREGLRTLVLGMRILSEEECSQWVAEYTTAATSIKNRDEMLTAAAESVERKLHIVGATAIEDKLQDGVPDTIALLGQAGIKLWVLTGDKRETAKEIGYATKVLTEKMRPGMIEVAKASKDEVRTRMAMAFLKLVKFAKLPEYQMSAIGEDQPKRIEMMLFHLGKWKRRMGRALRRFYYRFIKVPFLYCFDEVPAAKDAPVLKAIIAEEEAEKYVLPVSERRRKVRNRAEGIVRDYLNSPEGMAQRKSRKKVNEGAEIPVEHMDHPSSEGPDVFNRADSARGILQERRAQHGASAAEVRDLTMVNLTAHEVASGEMEGPLVEEDILSMRSFLPNDGEEAKKDFDRMKRTLLERLFSVDKAVRHGRLMKHLTKEKLRSIEEGKPADNGLPEEQALSTPAASGLEGPRALVIEGAALEYLLGDSELEELLFAVANTCDSVIACRVSPAQKAQLVQLVRRYVVPEPVTLAIGDGANDVGMIQEAHIGVGISGKEGQQAVNASDFAIAQFRFLLDLTLIHGRWNFMRMATVVLFSFYKNAVMAGCLIAYTRQTVYSGTPLFDEWNISVLNFVAGVPIAALGVFDRCLEKEYVKMNPSVYTPTRRNEIITKRTLGRWIILVLVHVFTLFFMTVPALARDGGGATSAFFGLMSNEDPEVPGNGEGQDLKSVGLVAYSCLIVLLAIKVCFEARSIIIGEFPAYSCKKDAESWPNRLAYTWIATGWLSIGFYLFYLYIYQSLGRSGANSFSSFTNAVDHAFHMRSRSWMLIILVPCLAMVFDVTGKVFSNLFYPTQTQIHQEIFATKSWKEDETKKGTRRSNGTADP